MLKHQLLSGETLEYEKPQGELAMFIDDPRTAVDDSTITEGAFIERLYSPKNPLLDKDMMPGRGTVTKAVFADVRYHLMGDLLGRKRVALGTLDMEKVRARYSMTVKDAAAAAGVDENAIHQAIAARRLSSMRENGERRVDPAQIATYRLAYGEPAAPVDATAPPAPGKTP